MLRAIRASWLIDGLSSSALPDAVVVVEGDRIIDIGTGDNLSLGPDVNVFDGEGCTVLPGLIDCHVHLSLNGKATAVRDMISSSNEQLYRVSCSNAAMALAAGITTVRDCGARDDVAFRVKEAVESGREIGPRLLISGRALTSVKGHFHYTNGEVASEIEARELIHRQLAEGADFVKVMASGGGITPGTDPRKAQFPASWLARMVDDARDHGSWVSTHCHAVESIAQAAVAGVRGIEHCTFLGPAGYPAIDEQVLGILSSSGAAVMLTLAAEHFICQTPAETTMMENTPEGQQAYLEAKRAVARAIREADVPIVAGSDAGVPGSPPHAVRQEIELLAGIGFSPMEAIQAATSKAAEFLGLSSQVGTVQRGRRADLLVVIGNPLENMRALSQPILVMKDGRSI